MKAIVREMIDMRKQFIETTSIKTTLIRVVSTTRGFVIGNVEMKMWLLAHLMSILRGLLASS